MATRIDDDFMCAEHDGRVIATAGIASLRQMTSAAGGSSLAYLPLVHLCPGDHSHSHGTLVQLYGCNGGVNQHWTLPKDPTSHPKPNRRCGQERACVTVTQQPLGHGERAPVDPSGHARIWRPGNAEG